MVLKRLTCLMGALALAVAGPALADDAKKLKIVDDALKVSDRATNAVTNLATTVVGLLKDDDDKKCGKDDKKAASTGKKAASGIQVGAGIRTSYVASEAGGPSGGRGREMNLDNLRLYLNGQANDWLGVEITTDINNAQGGDWAALQGSADTRDEYRVLDAVIDAEISDGLYLRAGRFIPPTDRANLSGPFYQNAWEFPVVTQTGYSNIFQGRDDGFVLHGSASDGMLKWASGFFEGERVGDGTSITQPNDDHMMWVGRAVVNLKDAEDVGPNGYYNQSTYYGEKEIIALGYSIAYQRDAHAGEQDYTAWSFDGLYEMPLDSGSVVTLEFAYYDVDDNGAGPAGRQGESYFLVASYLMSDTTSLGNLEGRLQPSFRYQDADRSGSIAGQVENQVDFALNYIIDGHAARLSVVLSNRHFFDGSDDEFRMIVGGQVQF